MTSRKACNAGRTICRLLLAMGLALPALHAEGETTLVQVVDRRATKWLTTSVKDVGTGTVQFTGDDTALGSFASLLANKLTGAPGIAASSVVTLKTADVKLSLSGVSIDQGAVAFSSGLVPRGALLAAPISALLSAFAKDKTASAVFCVEVDGKNYLGADARLFRFGAEGELRDAIAAAVTGLVKAIGLAMTTDSPACDPGWEGGQAEPE